MSLGLWLNEDGATKYSCLQHRDSSALHSCVLTARTGFTSGRDARTVGAQILSTSYLSKYSGQISVLGLLSVYVRTEGQGLGDDASSSKEVAYLCACWLDKADSV